MAASAAPAKQPPRNPVTGWPLKPHQRLATKEDAKEAWKQPETCRGTFPAGLQWELVPRNVLGWLKHDFEGMRGETTRLRAADLNSDEFALLLWDLTLWWSRAERWLQGLEPVPPPVPWAYLQPGRDHWGMLGTLAAALTHEEEEARDAARTPPPPIVTDTRSAEALRAQRDRAMLALNLQGLSAGDLVSLDLADVDWESQSLRLSYSTPDRPALTLALSEYAWYQLEAYLDLLPEVEGDGPLFPGRAGSRMSSRQARRIVNEDADGHSREGRMVA